MMDVRPSVLSIAGFDPSGCAGLLADTKVFESHGVQGIGVMTANTIQNIHAFEQPNWMNPETILRQLHFLCTDFSPVVVKIGIIENLHILADLLAELRSLLPEASIIWDPILKASAPFQLHATLEVDLLETCLRQINLLTPNADELLSLQNVLDIKQANLLSKYCNVLVKGGHQTGERAIDVLYTAAGVSSISSPRIQGFEKRGTGCVLSASIAAHMAKGKSMFESCCLAKQYMNTYLASSNSKVGVHHAVH